MPALMAIGERRFYAYSRSRISLDVYGLVMLLILRNQDDYAARARQEKPSLLLNLRRDDDFLPPGG